MQWSCLCLFYSTFVCFCFTWRLYIYSLLFYYHILQSLYIHCNQQNALFSTTSNLSLFHFPYLSINNTNICRGSISCRFSVLFEVLCLSWENNTNYIFYMQQLLPIKNFVMVFFQHNSCHIWNNMIFLQLYHSTTGYRGKIDCSILVSKLLKQVETPCASNNWIYLKIRFTFYLKFIIWRIRYRLYREI